LRLAALAGRRHRFFKRARVAAAALDALDELLLLVGRHPLEAVEHAGLAIAAVAAAREAAFAATSPESTLAAAAASAAEVAVAAAEVALAIRGCGGRGCRRGSRRRRGLR